MSFTIISPTRVEVDGKDAGNLVDYILANQGEAKVIAQALADWHASHVKEDERRETELSEAKKTLYESCEIRGRQLIDAINAAVQKFTEHGSHEDTVKEARRAELMKQLESLG